jgi:carbon-monoxide dehydrogenase small subunit
MAMPKQILRLTVNGRGHEILVEPHRTLVDVFREDLGLTGTKEGCGLGDCGACAVLLDGRPVPSCLVLAVQAEGREVTTIEGLALDDGTLHPIQQAFVDHGAIQCGFCTPGMILSAKALLDETKQPSPNDVRTALSGNLCRCTGYQKIVEAVMDAARRLRSQGGEP